jgi:hypothetical protein
MDDSLRKLPRSSLQELRDRLEEYINWQRLTGQTVLVEDTSRLSLYETELEKRPPEVTGPSVELCQRVIAFLGHHRHDFVGSLLDHPTLVEFDKATPPPVEEL